MYEFTRLYNELDSTTSTLEKRAALRAYFERVDDDEAAVALFFLTGQRLKRLASTKLLRELIAEDADLPDWLIAECREQVGDLSETVALLQSGAATPSRESLADTFTNRLRAFEAATDDERKRVIIRDAWRDFDADQRLVFHKLIRGGFRVGVQRRTVAHALAELAGLDVATVQQRLTGGVTPDADAYRAILSTKQQPADRARPLPFCLANQLEPRPRTELADAALRDPDNHGSPNPSADLPPDHPRVVHAEVAWVEQQLGDPAHYTAEWKYDGIRAQLVRRPGAPIVLFSRGEEIVTEQFPEIVAAAADLPGGVVLDGELVLIDDADRPRPFAELQTRLNRKGASLQQPSLFDRRTPAFIAYDALEADAADLREQSTLDRRDALERALADLPSDHPIRLAPLLDDPRAAAGQPDAPTWLDRAARRAQSRDRGVEGLMLKHVNAPYHTGRTRTGPTWWKWKVDPFTLDAVLVYAQPGTGRRATLYTDYTFALRDTSPADATSSADANASPSNGDLRLTTFTKAYSGLTQDEIERVDRFIRNNTTDRMGPVRAVTPKLVMEIAFEGVQRSDRHAAGVAVRFPRIARLRDDKSPEDADTLADLERLLPDG